jgi:L,D-transpeptidase ErfK/SrfK
MRRQRQLSQSRLGLMTAALVFVVGAASALAEPAKVMLPTPAAPRSAPSASVATPAAKPPAGAVKPQTSPAKPAADTAAPRAAASKTAASGGNAVASTIPQAPVSPGASPPSPPMGDEPFPRSSRLHGDILGELRQTVTWKTDNLLDIARAENLGLIEIIAANPGVDPWLPGAGTELVLPSAHILPSGPRQGIVVNLAELRLYYYDPERGPMTFPIGVGRDGFGTPVGSTKVTRKAADPTWYPTAGKRADDPTLPAAVPPGPDNPLGEFAVYLGWPTYLIHGTHKPDGVGRRVSRGCIRMYPEDIAFLYRRVPVGTPVRTVVEPVKVGRSNGHVYIEVHPSLDQIDQLELERTAKPEPLADQTDAILLLAGDDRERLDWAAIDRALAERKGIPVRITR